MKVLSFFKKKTISFLFILFTVLLVVLGGSNLNATKNGLALWANNVVPSLFPFFVAVELLKSTNLVYYLSKYLEKFMRPIFNVPGIAVFPFIIGTISGFPVGAKIVSDLYNKGNLTKDEAERTLIFCNNAGPLFVIGTVGYSFYSNSIIGVILLLCHILSSISVGILYGIFSKFHKEKISSSSINLNKNDDISPKDLGVILGNSIISGIKSILNVGGFVVLFSVIISMLNQTHFFTLISNIFHLIIPLDENIISAFLKGLIEFTNGLNILSSIPLKNINLKLVLSSFLIGFCGLCVLLQVLSITKNNLSIKRYIKGRILQGLISMFYAYLIFNMPWFNLNL